MVEAIGNFSLVWLFGAYWAFASVCHILSTLVVSVRGIRRKPLRKDTAPPVTIIRPVYERDNYLKQTLASTFALDYPHYEIVFCAARESDPAVPVVRDLIASHKEADVRLLIGNDRIGQNPKLNNLAKGWASANYDLVAFVDSNVMMPRDYLWQMIENWRPDTGLVTSPPVGSQPRNFWAEIECAFLNTYHARWQLFADFLHIGYAHGKNFMVHKSTLQSAGGIAALASQPAEDAAVTKIVRDAGLRIRVLPRPFLQPLGIRKAREVWDRQVRWAKLRRKTFPIAFLAEPLSGSVLPLISAAIVAYAFSLNVGLVVALMAVCWFGLELALARLVGWHSSRTLLFSILLRDISLPFLWIAAWVSDGFEWGGQQVSTTTTLAPVDEAD